MPSESVENYLTEILRFEETGRAAASSELAERLEVSRPSVTGMLKKLEGEGYIFREPYRAVRLSRKGRRTARAVIRRHRLVETFLVEALGMHPDRVHEEAHRLEHAFSNEVIERLDAWLGHPDKDPHGSPIPGRG
jgi:DtxR family transcriptional regulator, Mn-dependent transcriptional regulator